MQFASLGLGPEIPTVIVDRRPHDLRSITVDIDAVDRQEVGNA